MKRSILIALLTCMLAVPASAAADVRIASVDHSAYPTLRVTVKTSVPATKQPLLRENGKPIEGIEADNLGRCANVVLGIDRSQSMRGRAIANASSAAQSFVASKPGCTRVEIVVFGSKATELTGMSAARIDADYALRTIDVDAAQGTALWDAVVVAAHALAEQDSGGRVLILLTDGADTASDHTAEEAIAAARRAGVAAYAVGIESEQFSAAPLERLSGETGGSYHGAAGSASLAQIYSQIQHELERTWSLAYPTAVRPGETTKLDASVPGIGAAERRVFLPGSLGLGAAADEPDSIVPARVYEHGLGTLILMLLVGFLTLVVFALLVNAPTSRRLRRRIEPHVETRTRHVKQAKSRLGATRALMNSTEQAFVRFSVWRRLQELLTRADLPLRPAELFYVCVGCAFVPALLFAFAGAPSIILLVLMAGGAAAPVGVVWFKARQRLRQIDESLPDLLVTLAASLKAGHSFRQGIQATSEEDAGPLTKELTRVLTETSLGRPMDAALNEMAERVGSKDLQFVITAVTIQRQVGGSLAGIFDLVADTIRQRQQFARKIRGLTAMGRASMWTLVALPIALALMVTVINSEYMHPLWHTHAGHIMLEVMAAGIVLGWYSLNRIVNFKG